MTPVTETISQKLAPFIKATSDWGAFEWGAVAVGAVVFSIVGATFLSRVSSIN